MSGNSRINFTISLIVGMFSYWLFWGRERFKVSNSVLDLPAYASLCS